MARNSGRSCWARASLPAPLLFRLAIRLAIGAVVVAVATGFLLFAADPQVVALSPFFLGKLAILLALLANALLFHRRSSRATPGPAAAAVSLLGWTGALICGRLIAYW